MRKSTFYLLRFQYLLLHLEGLFWLVQKHTPQTSDLFYYLHPGLPPVWSKTVSGSSYFKRDRFLPYPFCYKDIWLHTLLIIPDFDLSKVNMLPRDLDLVPLVLQRPHSEWIWYIPLEHFNFDIPVDSISWSTVQEQEMIQNVTFR